MIKVQYINHMGNDLTVVNSARISFGRESEELDDNDKKLIKYLADNSHYTPFEHNTLTVIIECPLYIRSQIHRHRTFSYNEISRRYTSENIEFYLPEEDDIRKQSTNNKQCSEGYTSGLNALKAQMLIKNTHDECLRQYNKLIRLGVSREQARGVLPQNLMTKFYMTGNLRNWTHFLKLRLDAHAQKEVQEVAKSVYSIMLDKFPYTTKVLLDD